VIVDDPDDGLRQGQPVSGEHSRRRVPPAGAEMAGGRGQRDAPSRGDFSALGAPALDAVDLQIDAGT
jgi:hypothetical protein